MHVHHALVLVGSERDRSRRAALRHAQLGAAAQARRDARRPQPRPVAVARRLRALRALLGV
ncbi:hypothetical protein [Microlunatus kandeliicorticis]|uniref:hypothetical protein n=1 Tax=Microlunatus kandeliicorticis TaxID=1759536 RepID=UPI0015FC229C|nr:hypothetical protein [Microlunatus kandeliicorticis]